jgi:hypothetical protein
MEISKILKTFTCFSLLFVFDSAFGQNENEKNSLEDYDWLNEIIISTNKEHFYFKTLFN